MNRTIDHLVYAVPDLEIAMDNLEEQLGVRPVLGGTHPKQGTKNALLHLGGQTYLELLAVDSDNTTIFNGRWMGIDLITAPQFTRWAIHSTDLENDVSLLKKHKPQLATIQGGQRAMTNGKLLQWELSMPLAKPAVELLPFFIDWQHSAAHPCDNLSPQCRLVDFQLYHPKPDLLNDLFQKLAIEQGVLYSPTIQMKARIEGLKGILEL